jgi:hypothetical protein
VERRGSGLIRGPIHKTLCRKWRKPRRTSVRRTGVRTLTWPRDLLNAKRKCLRVYGDFRQFCVIQITTIAVRIPRYIPPYAFVEKQHLLQNTCPAFELITTDRTFHIYLYRDVFGFRQRVVLQPATDLRPPSLAVRLGTREEALEVCVWTSPLELSDNFVGRPPRPQFHNGIFNRLRT